MNLTDRPTPETDAEAYEPNGCGEWVVGVPFARDLEQRVSALREALEDVLACESDDDSNVNERNKARETLAATEPKT